MADDEYCKKEQSIAAMLVGIGRTEERIKPQHCNDDEESGEDDDWV